MPLVDFWELELDFDGGDGGVSLEDWSGCEAIILYSTPFSYSCEVSLCKLSLCLDYNTQNWITLDS